MKNFLILPHLVNVHLFNYLSIVYNRINIKFLNIDVRISLTFFLFLPCFNFIFSQTTDDMKLPIGLNFVIDNQENFHSTWGKKSGGIWYGISNPSGTIIKEFLFPNTQDCCGANNIALRNNNVVVVWRYLDITFNSYIRGQVFSTLQDSANQNNINFYDTYYDAERGVPTADFLNDTTLIVAWSGNGPQTPFQSGIYGEITTTSLNGLGGNFLINDYLENYTDAGLQKILVNEESKNFLAIWHDDRNRSRINKIYGRLFDFSGSALGSSFLISDPLDTAETFYLSGAFDKKNKEFAVVWAVESNPYWQIRWRWVDSEGMPISQSELLTTDEEPVLEYAAVDVAIDDEGKVLVVWEQRHKEYSTIFGRRFITKNEPYGQIFKVSKSEYESHQFYPKVEIKNNRVFVVWNNFKSGVYNDIYLRTIDFYDTTLVGIKENTDYIIDNFYLSQNYPNPTNSSTIIKFYLPSSSDVSIKIYNILGQEIIKLSDEYKPEGNHSIYWNGKDQNGLFVPSGIYFYNLTANGKSLTKKMMLLK